MDLSKVKVAVIASQQYNKSYISMEHNNYTSKWLQDNINGAEIIHVSTMEDADIVIFSGGTDISPALYGERMGKHCQNPNSTRDAVEVEAARYCMKEGKMMIGICRGAQLLTVLSGGTLIQHADGHNIGNHDVVCSYGKDLYEVNSLHHQMMNPYYLPREEYDLIAYCCPEIRRGEKLYLNGNDNPYELKVGGKFIEIKDIPYFMEPEVVIYKKTRVFAIQFHPEMGLGTTCPDTIRWLNYNIFGYYYSKALNKETKEKKYE